jgi:hypothetical protein
MQPDGGTLPAALVVEHDTGGDCRMVAAVDPAEAAAGDEVAKLGANAQAAAEARR